MTFKMRKMCTVLYTASTTLLSWDLGKRQTDEVEAENNRNNALDEDVA